MYHFLWRFLLLLLLLFALELSEPVQTAVIQPFTASLASVSAYLMQLFDAQVLVSGIVIRDATSGFGVAIRAGCNGVEAVLILIAAMLTVPKVTWRQRLVGILLGTLTIQALNLLRIISLFYLGQWNATAFKWAHLYLWEILIMLDVLLVFVLWLRHLSASRLPHATA